LEIDTERTARVGALGPTRTREPASLTAAFGIAANKVVRTEKVGSGGYTNLVKKNLRTGFPHIDAYGESRKDIAFKCIDGYYKKIKSDRKKDSEPRKTFDGEEEDDAAVAARDAVNRHSSAHINPSQNDVLSLGIQISERKQVRWSRT
jgi:hypothetical protein